METIGLGILFGIAFIWPYSSLPQRLKAKLNGYAFSVDIIVGAVMAFLFFGTQGGMIIATVATVLFTAYLHLWSIPNDGVLRLTWSGWKVERQ